MCITPNVTNLLAAANTVEGEYTVANVKAALGQVEGGSAAGWALVDSLRECQ